MRTILLVEDDPEISVQVAAELAGQGFCVRRASGEEDAIAVLGRESVDLIVIDPAIRGAGGLDLMRLLIEKRPQTPIVIHSGDPGLQENFACWMADRFVLKWGDPDGLLGAVREALGCHAA